VIARAIIIFTGGAMLSLIWPGKILDPFIRPAEHLGEWLIPGVQSFRIEIDQPAVLKITSVISHPLHMQDGSIMPAIDGRWSKRGGDLLAMLVVALAAWSIPALDRNRRLWSIGVIVPAVSLLISLDVILAVQADVYSSINLQSLLTLPLAGSDANLAAFNGMILRGKITSSILGVLDSGGRLALAAITGFLVSILFQSRGEKK